MANKIKTRILLRNDTLANWQANNSVALGKGEIAIADLGSNKFEVRVGGGNTSWANSLQLNVNAANISGLIETIQGTAGKYRIVQDGTNAKWTLQTCPISATGDAEWTDVNVAIDLEDRLSGIEEDISTLQNDLTSAVSELSGAIDSLSDVYLTQSDFATISTTIGLDAASATNKVVTLSDIADLAGAMHFVGTITLSSDEETVADAVARLYPDHTAEAGDVVVVTSNSKEYVYAGGQWVELGDEDLYAKKAEVEAAFNDLSNTISTNYATKTELNDTSVALSTDYVGKIADAKSEAITSANAYTDGLIEALDLEDSGTGFVTVVTQTDGQVAVTKKTIELSDITDYESTISAYATKSEVNDVSVALSTDYVGKIADAKSEAITSANAYTDDQISATLDEYFILDCGSATLRTGEPEAPFSA